MKKHQVVFNAFHHRNNSCFIDSLFVALFQPTFVDDIMEKWLFDTNRRTPAQQTMQTLVQQQINELHSPLNWQGSSHSKLFVNANICSMLQQYDGKQAQSVIDFFHFFIHALGANPNLLSLGRETITFTADRVETLHCERYNFGIALWQQTSTCITAYDSKNAAQIPDRDDQYTLQQSNNKLKIYINEFGDERRIQQLTNTMLLCPVDHSFATIPITEQNMDPSREKLVNGKVRFTRTIFHKIPKLLLFEVSRRFAKRSKVVFGQLQQNNEWILTIQSQQFRLQSVICLVKSHYVVFVRVELEATNTTEFQSKTHSMGSL